MLLCLKHKNQLNSSMQPCLLEIPTFRRLNQKWEILKFQVPKCVRFLKLHRKSVIGSIRCVQPRISTLLLRVSENPTRSTRRPFQQLDIFFFGYILNIWAGTIFFSMLYQPSHNHQFAHKLLKFFNKSLWRCELPVAQLRFNPARLLFVDICK